MDFCHTLSSGKVKASESLELHHGENKRWHLGVRFIRRIKWTSAAIVQFKKKLKFEKKTA